MPQGVPGYSPEILAILEKIRALTGPQTTQEPSVVDALKRATGIEAGEPAPANPAWFMPEQGLSPLETALTRAKGLEAGSPSLSQRFGDALRSVLGMFQKAPGATTASPLNPEWLMPEQGPTRVATPSTPARMSGNVGATPLPAPAPELEEEPPVPSGFGPSERVQEEFGRLFPSPPTQAGLISQNLPVSPTQAPVLAAQMGASQEAAQPGLWSQFGTELLSGIASTIVPAIVGWAADRRNSPEMVQAWSHAESNKLREAQLEQQLLIAQMREAGRLLAAQQAQERLFNEKLHTQLTLHAQARELQKEVAPKDPLTFIKSMQGLSNLVKASGADSDVFLDTYKLPNAPLLDQLRKDFEKGWGAARLNPDLRHAAFLRNPWLPDIKEANLTLDTAAQLLGHVSPSGRVIEALGSISPEDVIKQIFQDTSGKIVEKLVPTARALEEPAVRFPAPESLSFHTFMEPTSDEPVIVGFDRITGRPVFRNQLRGLRLPPFSEPLGGMIRGIEREMFTPGAGPRNELERAKEELRKGGLSNPTDEQARRWLEKVKK